MPLVAETTGAWDPAAALVLKRIARFAAMRTGRSAEEEWQELMQRTSVCVRRARARAALRLSHICYIV